MEVWSRWNRRWVDGLMDHEMGVLRWIDMNMIWTPPKKICFFNRPARKKHRKFFGGECPPVRQCQEDCLWWLARTKAVWFSSCADSDGSFVCWTTDVLQILFVQATLPRAKLVINWWHCVSAKALLCRQVMAGQMKCLWNLCEMMRMAEGRVCRDEWNIMEPMFVWCMWHVLSRCLVANSLMYPISNKKSRDGNKIIGINNDTMDICYNDL